MSPPELPPTVHVTGTPELLRSAVATALTAHPHLFRSASADEPADALVVLDAAGAGASGRSEPRFAVVVAGPGGHLRLATSGVHPSTVDELVVAVSVALGAAPPGPVASSLTPRQTEVLDLLAQGLPPKQIAGRLGISTATCRDHVKAVREALGATSAGAAVAEALRRGWVSSSGAEDTGRPEERRAQP